jgi:hypothetical protein
MTSITMAKSRRWYSGGTKESSDPDNSHSDDEKPSAIDPEDEAEESRMPTDDPA